MPTAAIENARRTYGALGKLERARCVGINPSGESGVIFIHQFPNSSGRCSRLMVDHVLDRLGSPRFTMGSSALRNADEIRAAYIAALKAADEYDDAPLLAFVRS